ncbi:protein fantom-like [Centruroides sculpturatus]|uniref:protein fantom-like n=1 Tax=Centruroides sculpturatus TaxID=218467 RepID=UPI000C6DF8BD|nr:protein fantom-like [Centruroides sculpturatus]
MDASDSGRDLIPVKEKKDDTVKQFPSELDRTFRIERHAISHIDHDDLEDKYLRLHDEHILLKKYARKQEDKIKKLATKLSRLINDKKRLEQEGGTGNRKRDVEMEELVQDLQDKVREVEKQNCQLREKLLIAKQQALIHAKRPSGYRYVTPRVDSGRSKPGTPSRTGSPATRLSYFHPSSRVSPSSALPNYAWSLVEEARNEIKHLEETVNSLRSQLDIVEQENEILKEQLKLKEFEYNEELLNLKSQLTQGQKQHVQENMDLIQLHREVKRKSSKMANLQAQYNDLDEKIKSLKMSNDLLLKETDKLNKLLREEQNKNLELQEELGKASSIERTMIQFQEQITDLTNENKILKESNQKLIDSALGEERYQHYESRESTFKQQITKLEATLKADLKEKETLLANLAEMKEENSQFKIKCKELEENYSHYKSKFEELENKMNLFNKETDIDILQLEEALDLIQRRKLDVANTDKSNEKEEKDLKAELQQSQIDHAETIAELDKTRNMLVVQYKINKDYEAEIETIKKKTEQMEKEYQTKLEEYNYLLEMRETRLKKLERELNDIAYGTNKYKIQTADLEDQENVVELERGKNLLEIHINSVILKVNVWIVIELQFLFLKQETDIDILQLEEALDLIQRRKLDVANTDKSNEKEEKDLKAELQQSQIDHAETIAELDKTRNMLVVQYKINKDYEAEIETIKKKTEQMEKEYQTKLEEYNYLLEMRETRLKKLERELNDIAYGTNKYKIQTADLEDQENVVELERGKNLLEIHINSVILKVNVWIVIELQFLFLKQETDIDILQLEEALDLIQRRKLDVANTDKSNEKEEKDLKAELQQSQIDHAETIAELDKTRNMLVVQYKINKDYEAEIETIKKKTEQMEKEYQTKLEEYNYLLEMRETRLKKLERELNDIAYGTNKYKIQTADLVLPHMRHHLAVFKVNRVAFINFPSGYGLFERHA